MADGRSLMLRVCALGTPLSYDQVIVRGCPAAPLPPALSDFTLNGSRSAMIPAALCVPHDGEMTTAVTLIVNPEPMARRTRSVPAPLRIVPPSIAHE